MNTIRKTQLEKEVKQALKHKQSYQKIKEYNQLKDKATQHFLQGIINSYEFAKILRKINASINEIICYTFDEFVFGLECLNVSKEEIDIAIEHESEHFNEAIRQKLKARFCIRVDLSEDGRLGISYGTQVNFNAHRSLSEGDKRNRLRASITAPRNLSMNDKFMLGISK